ncbi:PilZ domain-containing protein [Hahella sp. CCB-MM4]|uniref:PilZ domain-containing protein n=1 Tax=Hahella sp. (strain CCB-MM4) TaxID=1926491 RepID=UPI000B9AC8A7|nr:PilZ domain-containing protein [Hahella sp. CCB-MM4]OZG73688.1 PilZ domain-containing protein [Hahella sp. CCB-MM4]
MRQRGKPDNRRDFFRIKDRGLIEYVLYDNIAPGFEQFFRHPVYFELINELQALDVEFQHMLSHIPDSERTAAALIKILNKKIDLIARTVTMVETNISDDSIQEMDISEGGMAFCTSTELKVGQKMAIKFTAVPAYLSIASLAEVISCDSIAYEDEDSGHSSRFQVRVNFVDMDEHQRQLIARYILKIQQQARRRELAKN